MGWAWRVRDQQGMGQPITYPPWPCLVECVPGLPQDPVKHQISRSTPHRGVTLPLFVRLHPRFHIASTPPSGPTPSLIPNFIKQTRERRGWKDTRACERRGGGVLVRIQWGPFHVTVGEMKWFGPAGGWRL
eukprot:749599-Hanusia_phi.AAC.2